MWELWLLVSLAKANLSWELYKEAAQSPLLQTDFLRAKRQSSHAALLLHDANCPHCRQALPELAAIAEQLQGEPVVLAHADCTHSKDIMKRTFNLEGFPGFLFWRQQSGSLDEVVDKMFVVDTDMDFILRASRLANLGQERDRSRLALAGQEVTVRRADDKDMTLQVETSKKQLVWLPHEVVLQQGRRVPYRRSEGAARYRNVWEKELMLQFVQRLMKPLVSPLNSLNQLEELSLVLCAPLTRGFLEAAVAHQLTLRAFQTNKCDEFGEGQHVLVYSPASLQWTAVPERAKAAVTVADQEVVEDDQNLVAWVAQHHYPGITALGLRNFHLWVSAGRPTVLLAVNKHDIESNILVEMQLKKVAPPTASGGMELYTYRERDRFLGVADGRLPGFEYFGVRANELPRVVAFDDSEHWVEDRDYLTAERLAEHLPRVARMWRMSGTPRGYALWVAKQFVTFYLRLDRQAGASLGYPGRCLVVFSLAVLVWIQGWLLILAVRSIALNIRKVFEGDDAVNAARKGLENKKDK
ncbi:unnamed protein product [Effrenium voratum]|uniref:Thioredoxin domain-containing protein n=1 Tax=Effrenium voratum TaxID=2562239 RepID=A0AA36N271_9DINO|nr:unnamed protein product [Effrenium voratum]CAJ1459483.1 unnamed protein product [Effrenium voratum]